MPVPLLLALVLACVDAVDAPIAAEVAARRDLRIDADPRAEVGAAIAVEVSAAAVGEVLLFVSEHRGRADFRGLTLDLRDPTRADRAVVRAPNRTVTLRIDGALTGRPGALWVQVAQRSAGGWRTSAPARIALEADRDADGLWSLDEARLGTDPNAWDSDGDRAPDGWEVANGYDPTVADGAGAADRDRDGLGEALESWLGTDPGVANPPAHDADGDGVADGLELSLGTNPRVVDAKLCDPNRGYAVALAADRDDDCLDAAAEAEIGTDPRDPDTDDDGLPDGVERFDAWRADDECWIAPITCATQGHPPSFDPLDPDVDSDGCPDGVDPNPFAYAYLDDADGLADCDELAAGTDARDADSDDDGLLDGAEVRLGADPRSPDSDGDGVLDGQESALGTDLRVADTDGDGLSDGDEARVHFTLPTRADSDQGGLDDADELAAGRDPADPTDDGFGVQGPRLQLAPRLVIHAISVAEGWEAYDEAYSWVEVVNEGALPELGAVELLAERWSPVAGASQVSRARVPPGATARLYHRYAEVITDEGWPDLVWAGDLRLWETPYNVGALRLQVDGVTVDSWGAWGVHPAGSDWEIPMESAASVTRNAPATPRGESAVRADWSYDLNP